MKKAAIFLLIALLAIPALGLAAQVRCIKLKDADYYGGDIYLELHIGYAQGSYLQPLLVTGEGHDSKGHSIQASGTCYKPDAGPSPGPYKENLNYVFSAAAAQSQNPSAWLSVFYSINAVDYYTEPYAGKDLRIYSGKWTTSDGEKKNISGTWENVECENSGSSGSRQAD